MTVDSAREEAPVPDISPVMQQLAAYCAAAPDAPLPDVVEEKVRHHVLDTIAAMVSGAHLFPGTQAISYVTSQGGTVEASVPGTGLVTTATNAALAGGMLAHADETDDSHAASLTHPGCAVVPAALAMAQRCGSSGAELLRAVALGYDVGCRMTLALHAYDFRDAGHSTHSFGPMFGSAVAAGALARLGDRGVRHLLSYTAQQASGVACWMRDPDHVEKAFDFGGMPARNGVAAATMVQHGFTGVEDVFSGQRNFFLAYDESGRIGRPPVPERLLEGLGETFEIMNTNIKRWSVGSPIQAPLDGLFALVHEEGLRADHVTRLDVRVAHHGAVTVNDRDMANICLQHLCALMLVDRNVTFVSAHDQERMADPAVLDVRGRVHLHGDDEMTAAMPSRQAFLDLELRDGRRRRVHVDAVRGTFDNPMTRAEVDAKCFDLMAPVLGDDRARELCDAVWAMDGTTEVSSLRRLWKD
ncbi:2-methylcitrate dehydratase PrpD [Blastococcus colisei]|uniref:2-methylcitrate dehydratase PrpD n=1 Tax=Blastococcus colisei TaxID=1564162 RepID=A0A543P1Q1_9ACTN|nr:MmgE/PrpD family protein [Blastococcus colisei]TQN38045.1 2-methylcitrate dehydratase PrpD [Blastococcus colisei]